MSNLNIVAVQGRLTRDAELNYLKNQNGTAVSKFSIACNEYRKGAENNQYVHYFDIVVWGKMAENVSKYLSKGSAVNIEGQLQQERWQTKDGENRSRIVITAKNVYFLSANKKDDTYRGEVDLTNEPQSFAGSDDDEINF